MKIYFYMLGRAWKTKFPATYIVPISSHSNTGVNVTVYVDHIEVVESKLFPCWHLLDYDIWVPYLVKHQLVFVELHKMRSGSRQIRYSVGPTNVSISLTKEPYMVLRNMYSYIINMVNMQNVGLPLLIRSNISTWKAI